MSETAEQDASEKEQQEPPEEKTSEKKNEGVRSSKSAIALGKDVQIYTDAPLPGYDVGPIKAYRAVSEGYEGECIALICERHLVPRYKSASTYASFTHPSLAQLIKRGVVFWPHAGHERHVFVYMDYSGKRLLGEGATPALGLRLDGVMKAVVEPMVEALEGFRNKDFFHGGIRPSNMFGTSTGDKLEKVVLGDCLSVPPSYAQPVLYETIERSMADPVSRGRGTPADDMYAFGVSIAVMLRTNDPLEGLDEEGIIREKLEHSSYSALTGTDRFKGSILELLRGLLQDDSEQRWTIEEVLSWMDGRRLSPKQSVRAKKAPRPIVFAGEKYLLASLLAMDLGKDLSETNRIVETSELERWLDRALDDEETIARCEFAKRMAAETSQGDLHDARLVANLSVALDPFAPIRFKGMHLMAEGVGTTLASTMVLEKDIKPLVEMLTHNVVLNWITLSENPNLDKTSLVSKFEASRNFIKQTKSGYGIERCLYSLCPEAHCLSQSLKDYYVTTPESLMWSFEDLCKKGKAPSLFLDRHCVSFLSVRDAKIVDVLMYDLASDEEHRIIISNLKCLAKIQRSSKIGPFPALAKTFASRLSVVYQRYHDRTVREKLESSINVYAEAGDLPKMSDLLSNVEMVKQDGAGFKNAMAEYRNLTIEAQKLAAHLANKDSFGKAAGKEVAAVVSSILASLVILFMAFLFFTNQSFL